MTTTKSLKPTEVPTPAARRILRHTYPMIHRHATILQREQWSDEPWNSVGLTWNVRKILAPLGEIDGGNAAASVTYRGRRELSNGNRILNIPLQRMFPRLEAGHVNYTAVRHEHELGLVAFPGATRKTLDANVPVNKFREPALRASNVWAYTGLELLNQQCKFIMHNEPGLDAPQLPTVFVGVAKPGAANIAGDAAKAAVASIVGCSKDMTDAELQQHLLSVVNGKTVRELLCVAPMTASNTTARWLIRQDYLSYIGDRADLYEDFTGLCGIEVFNPAKLLGQTVKLPNPVRLAAVQAGVDYAQLQHDLLMNDRISDNQLRREAEADANDIVMSLVAPIRRLLGECSDVVSDEAIFDGIMRPKHDIETSVPSYGGMSLDAQVNFGFGYMNSKFPHLQDKITNADMQAAFAAPHLPLYARKACIVQHIQLNDVDGRTVFVEDQVGHRMSITFRWR